MDATEALTAVAVYAVCTVAFIPGLALTLAYGAIYGTLAGGLVSLAGATTGAAIAAALTRFYLSGTVLAPLLTVAEDVRDEDRLPSILRGWRQRVRTLYEMVDRHGVRTVVITRLTPVIPFNVLNYLLGLTTLPLWQMSLLSLVCMAPACFIYAWIGAAGAGALREGDPRYLLLALAGVGLLLLLKPLATRLAAHLRRERPKRLDKP